MPRGVRGDKAAKAAAQAELLRSQHQTASPFDEDLLAATSGSTSMGGAGIPDFNGAGSSTGPTIMIYDIPPSGGYFPSVDVSDVSTSEDEDDEAWMTDADLANGTDDLQTEERSNSPSKTGGDAGESDNDDDEEGGDSKGNKQATCRWEDCGEVFVDLQLFIDHLHNFHVGTTRTKYACEWTGCSRRGKPQTSRFALLSHLRSHTGEKPFTCPRIECDKSFTRSDALSKHMKVQHDIQLAGPRSWKSTATIPTAVHPPGSSSAGASTRTSGRRSAASAALNASTDSLEDDNQDAALSAAPATTAAATSSNLTKAAADFYEALPGQPMLWDYDVQFASQAADEVNGSKSTDSDLDIERLSAIQDRFEKAPSKPTTVEVEMDDVKAPPTKTAWSQRVDSDNMSLTLEVARRNWIEAMSAKQSAELEQEGASQGAFVNLHHKPATATTTAGGTESERDVVDESDEGGGNSSSTSRSTSMSYSRPSATGLSLFTNSAVPAGSPNSSSPLNGRSTTFSSAKRGGAATSASHGSTHLGNASMLRRSIPGKAPASPQSQSQSQPQPTPQPSQTLSTTTDLQTLKKACLIETSKLHFLRDENARLVADLEAALREEKVARREKRKALEAVLVRELGGDVRAIITPDGSDAEDDDEVEQSQGYVEEGVEADNEAEEEEEEEDGFAKIKVSRGAAVLGQGEAKSLIEGQEHVAKEA